ncbi:chemotaxis protein CheC [Natronobacterium texcoconense]|uniref:Chemotaxis protein CheC n=1 Tax=Natronobacterium texcoconense TaxID=1095778 RepID=A0A1H1HQL7_NATTX|nr:chemotaxis protein CheC [Natronobacterium texcoconense]SDR27750.1 chemotaxis protein CheC [Natronobacterium texcoconense]
MEIDIHSLKTYNELAKEGAESAASALSELTDIETRVEVTDVSLLSAADLQYEFDGREFAGVKVGSGEPLSGETVLVFDGEGRETITNNLVPSADREMTESAILEVGNIMVNGFVSGWANHLDASVDISPPDYVEGTGIGVLPETRPESNEYAFVFRNRVEAVDDSVGFYMLLFPEIASLERILENRTNGGIPREKLEVFTEMTERGATKAANNVTAMTDLSTGVEVNRLSFVPIADIPAHVSDDRRVGTAVEYTGTPSGYLGILFDPAAARTAVDALLSVESEGEWTDKERSALEELCNVIASGFIDGWANVLETSIRHSPPEFIADMGSSIMSPIIADIARTEEYAFMLDSTIRTGESETLQCQLFALPQSGELETALEELLVKRAGETDADPDAVF